MTRSIGNLIADSLGVALGYADRLLKDVPPERFGRFAAPGGVVVRIARSMALLQRSSG